MRPDLSRYLRKHGETDPIMNEDDDWSADYTVGPSPGLVLLCFGLVGLAGLGLWFWIHSTG